MGILAVALFLVPGQGWRNEALYAAKMGTIPLPRVDVRAAMQTPLQVRLPPRESLPRKPVSPVRDAVPALSDKGVAIAEKLSKAGGALGNP
jgi:hypothetical protein